MGAQFVEAVGGEAGITPKFNRLATEGLLFTDLYSTGTRSVRGMEAMVSGFLPVPGESVVKRIKSQRNFFTLANLLKPFGYHSSFIYGGEKRFDNMGGWYVGNGFDLIIDQNDYENTAFSGVWGVSDEDLMERANEEFSALYEKKQPFVSVVFSTTNHTPYEFPEGRIELIEGVAHNSVKNAIKFADYAIGRFFELARAQNYYQDTIFVVVADHNVRVYGDGLIPVHSYHIPALILGEGVPKQKYQGIVSQPDVLATALDLLGVDLRHPVLGKSIFASSENNLAFMQYYETYGLRQGDRIAILAPEKQAQTFSYENKRLQPIDHDIELERDLLAFINTASYLYENRLHSMAPPVQQR